MVKVISLAILGMLIGFWVWMWFWPKGTLVELIERVDFRAWYSASILWNKGVRENFYDLSVQFENQKSIFGKVVEPIQTLIYWYPPVSLVLLQLFGLVSLEIAYLAWMGVNMLGICLMILLLSFRSRWSWESWILLTLTNVAILETWFQGQYSIWIGIVLLVSWLLWKGGKLFLSGLAASLVLLKIQYYPFLLLGFLLMREWRTVKGMIVGAILLSTISIGLLRVDGIVGYIRLLIGGVLGSGGYGLRPITEPSVWGVITTMGLSGLQRLVAWSVIVVCIGVLLVRIRDRSRRWGIVILFVLLVSMHTSFQDVTWLLLFERINEDRGMEPIIFNRIVMLLGAEIPIVLFVVMLVYFWRLVGRPDSLDRVVV